MKSNWDYVPLGEIAPARSAPMPAEDAVIWNLSLEDIEGTTGRILHKQRCRVKDLGSQKCSFDGRYVLFSKLRPYLNKVALPDEPGVGTSELIPLLPVEQRLDREFLAHYLRSQAFLDFANANTRGANLPRIAMAELWAHKIPVPRSLADQRRIVARVNACIERVAEIEGLRSDSIKEQQHLSASLIESELHADVADANKWQPRAVGELVFAVRNGKSIPQDTNGHADGAVLTLTSVRSPSLDVQFRKSIVLPEKVAGQFGIDQGDVFVSRANTIELVGLASVAMEKPADRLIYPDLLIKLKIDRTQIQPRYLAYALRSASARRQIKARALGSSRSMVKISGERLREVTVPVPSLVEQERIVGRLDAAHDLMRHLSVESESGEIAALRSAVLRKAFAGEL
ncbi:restriction endonuclease subunit S [Bradyrhizobium sp. HKCCYLRH1030]|uniref:restriction endonuclease subunit S n=1 Tax=Bradyrhizobium sp. HKCCYLRH1030 TaxID=3420744 RepID=UPI003EB69619